MKASSVDEVLDLYVRWGEDRYDEEVTQLAHALQTAALASAAGAADELVAAALLHDVGHLLHVRDGVAAAGGVDLRHEAAGAAWLAPLFPAAVTGPIALHVRAKRYRCAVDPEYHDLLSDGSKRSLERQGGPLHRDEVEAFRRLPRHEDAVRLREFDDGGKVDGLDVPTLEHYRGLLRRVVTRPSAAT